MKAFRIIPVLFAALVFVGCSSNKRTAYDDTYYSPYRASRGQQVNQNGGTVSPITTNTNYDYQAYYGDSKNYEPNVDPVYQTTETVTDTNGVVYTTTETYYDADFAARVKRFGSQASSSLDYYDDYYTSSSNGGGNTYVYVGDTWGWGFYPYYSYRPYYYSYWDWDFYYGWGYPYYYSYWHRPWYSPYYWYGGYWGWYSPYWYHPYHHHHHHHPYHDHFGGSGWNNHNGGPGGHHNDFGSYVASVRQGNSTNNSSMSRLRSNIHDNNGRNIASQGSGAGRTPSMSGSASRPTTSSSYSSSSRPSTASRPTISSRPSSSSRPSASSSSSSSVTSRPSSSSSSARSADACQHETVWPSSSLSNDSQLASIRSASTAARNFRYRSFMVFPSGSFLDDIDVFRT